MDMIKLIALYKTHSNIGSYRKLATLHFNSGK